MTSEIFEIAEWNGINGYGYEKTPFSGNISTIHIDEIIVNEIPTLNTDGNKNTYTYDIKI